MRTTYLFIYKTVHVESTVNVCKIVSTFKTNTHHHSLLPPPRKQNKTKPLPLKNLSANEVATATAFSRQMLKYFFFLQIILTFPDGCLQVH